MPCRNAVAGAELVLEDGTYTGSHSLHVLLINKDITIRAQNAGMAVLDGEDVVNKVHEILLPDGYETALSETAVRRPPRAPPKAKASKASATSAEASDIPSGSALAKAKAAPTA